MTAMRDAAGNAFVRTRPALALMIDSGHPGALGALTDEHIVATALSGEAGRAGVKTPSPDTAALRAALRRDPLSADLLRQLATISSAGGETVSSRQLMELAQRVSRRDFLTQMWMNEAAVADGDIDRALSHYDIALTTSKRAAPALLFPVLTRAIAIPQVSAALARYISARRPWVDAFLTQAIATGDPRAVAALLAKAGVRGNANAFAAAQSGLIGSFVVHKDYAGLGDYAATMPSADRAAIRTIDFAPATTDGRLRPLTWELTDDSDLGAAYQPGQGLTIRARSGTRGIVARRILYLPTGRWRLRQHVSVVGEAQGPSVSWEAYCLDSMTSDAFWSQALPRRSGAVQSEFVVPAGCRAVEMRLVASAGMDDPNDLSMTVSKVALDRAG
ncbi:hypothetical protein [uncultured Sphingomonas sp.]|jgi:hypothetical protein|uniref:hypothetical protein n=1 Tax=uncultured Sphingomonas sp. TaxID=158754 RepID=UPI0030DC23C1